MNKHIGKILPIDGYFVLLREDISITYYQSLTHLYQPLLGANGISLYQTLLSEGQLRGNSTSPQTHHLLMNYMGLPLDDIYQARLKLEAIGLLSTWKEDDEQQTTYYYQLHQPFSPSSFLNDGMLSQLLYHQIGEKKFNDIVKIFTQNQKPLSLTSQQVTANFNDVFQTNNQMLTHTTHSYDQNNNVRNNGPFLDTDKIDFNWLEQMLKQRMLPTSKVITPQNKKLFTQMVVLYDLTNQDIEKAVLWALNDENMLDINEFKTACHDLRQSKPTKANNKINQKETISVKQPENDTLTKEQQFVQMLESISPKQLLEDLSGGNAASSQDLKVIGDVMTQQGLSPGVMNVLIHYVLLKTDMKLSKAYLEKIASHWARKNVTTVRQAMTLAKSESNKYQQWGNTKQSYSKKPTKKEVVPDWFTERKAKEDKQKQNTVQEQSKKEDIAKLLKNYSNK